MFELHSKGRAIAVVDDKGDCISYAKLAEFLQELKIAKRKLCFNLCENSIGSLVGYACMIDCGVVPVMLSSDLDSSLLLNLLEVYKPEFLWIPAHKKQEFSGFQIVLKIILERYSYALIKTDFKADLTPLHNDLALLLSTSGSTGSVKLVRQSYKNIESNTHSIIKYLGITANERPVTLLPMHYTYGLSVINTHLKAGACIFITQKALTQRELWDFIKEHKITSIAGIPYIYEMLKRLGFFKMDLPHLSTMTQAGGKLGESLHKEFAEFAKKSGKKFVVMYGQTEATARMGYLPPEMALEKIGAMGVAIPGGEFGLVDENGGEIRQSEVPGELIYKGENVMMGYANNRADLSKGDEKNGILATGDIALKDKDGFYYIIGRKKRFIKIFGKRVNLDEIDSLIKTKFKGVVSASVGVDDRLSIFVESVDSKILESIKKYICNATKINLTAISVESISKIPRNESGKILYSALGAL